MLGMIVKSLVFRVVTFDVHESIYIYGFFAIIYAFSRRERSSVILHGIHVMWD